MSTSTEKRAAAFQAWEHAKKAHDEAVIAAENAGHAMARAANDLTRLTKVLNEARLLLDGELGARVISS